MAGARIQRGLLGSHLLLIALTQVLATLLIHRRLGAETSVWLAGLCAMAMALALAWVLARRLSRPLVAMTAAARRMTEGHFDAPLPEPTDDEIGDLVLALHALRQQQAARLDELRAEGEKLRTILNGMTEGVALVQGGVITVANPSFRALLGAPADVEGRTPLEAARLPELAEALDRSRSRSGRFRVISDRPSPGVESGELEAGKRTLAFKVVPLRGAGEDLAVLVLLDVTDAKRLERVRRDFVANASHELRTPVAAIVAAAETLAAGAAEDPQARDKFIEILLRHAERLSRLTSDLLDLSRLEAGYRPRAEAIPVAAALDTVLATLAPRTLARRITVTSALPADLPAVRADRAAVEQILTNLLDNAIKYTPEGGEVRVRASAAGRLVTVIVEDTGAGIPAAHLPRLFERFYRVDHARSRELGGTGLGLAIAKHLVLANGGEIRVESEVGRGSRFLVELPRA